MAAAAHGAKGEARNAAAKRLGDLYAEIEAKAKSKDLTGGAELMASLSQELNRVDAFIHDYSRRAS